MGKLNIDVSQGAKRVFDFFEEISAVPRGSGNTKGIADYLVSFAKTRRLLYYRDECDNVIIKKGATVGYENRPTVILQGHTDIVADKIKGSTRDLVNEGLELYLDGDFIRAKETTLGSDNGIAVAMALAILDSRDIPHPAIEALFTSDEEIGLIGATALDTSHLTGKTLINLDSDEEGIFTVGCAGGLRVDMDFAIKKNEVAKSLYSLSVAGLIGGHSGIEINKNRFNANKVLAELLSLARNVEIAEIYGGNADNAIAREAGAIFKTDSSEEELLTLIKKKEAELKTETENAHIALKKLEGGAVFSRTDTERVLSLILSLHSGVVRMERNIPDMVETSMNLGVVGMTENGVRVTVSVRSSKADRKEEVKKEVRKLAAQNGALVSERGEYPAWEYKQESHLREVMVGVYREKYGREPVVITIHAGLECGIFSEKIKDLDCVSIGPDELDIHTPDERLSVSSTERVYEFLLEVLKKI